MNLKQLREEILSLGEGYDHYEVVWREPVSSEELEGTDNFIVKDDPVSVTGVDTENEEFTLLSMEAYDVMAEQFGFDEDEILEKV